MKEAIVDPARNVTIRDVDIPTPTANQVLIKVIVSGTNPKDWKVPMVFQNETNTGDDIAGIVESVGKSVLGFKAGDRVAAFHQMFTPFGSFAEYAIAWENTTFHIPEKTSFEEAATIPLAAMTAALGLYRILQLPLPWVPATTPTPVIIYGGAGAVGAYAIKLARLSNIHPIIAIAGRGIPFVESLLDKDQGDIVIDYRDGNSAVVFKIRETAKGQPILYAFDAVSEKGTIENILSTIDQGNGKIAVVLPLDKDAKFPGGIKATCTDVGTVHAKNEAAGLGDSDLGAAFYTLFGRGLAAGWFSGHPHEVVEGGLRGVKEALGNLESGKASAVKYVLRIGETS